MEQNYQLLARYLAGECTEREEEKIDEWLRKDPDNHRKMKEFKRIWLTADSGHEVVKWINTEQDWQVLKQRIDHQKEDDAAEVGGAQSSSNLKLPGSPVHSRVQQLGRVAAILVIIALIGVISYQNWYPGESDREPPVLREIITEKGQQINLTLADGSRVQLNADSKIKLPKTFQSDIREVFLQGEAFFDIERDPSKPFLIHSAGAVVRVLGTSLAVRAYPEDEQVRVVVKEGRVSLGADDKEIPDTTILVTSELGRYSLSDKKIEKQQVEDLDLYLAWTERFLKFREASMVEVGRQLERQYDVAVAFEDSGIQSMKLTALLKSRSIRNVLDVITASLNISYRLEDNRVTFYKRED